MDAQGYGKMYEGIVRLAMAGAVAMAILSVATVVGVGALAWWAWNHLSIQIH